MKHHVALSLVCSIPRGLLESTPFVNVVFKGYWLKKHMVRVTYICWLKNGYLLPVKNDPRKLTLSKAGRNRLLLARATLANNNQTEGV